MSSAQFCKPNAGKSYSKSTVFPMSGLQNWAQTRCIRYEHASGYLRQNLKTLNTYKRKKTQSQGMCWLNTSEKTNGTRLRTAVVTTNIRAVLSNSRTLVCISFATYK